MTARKYTTSSGFTIVELLIVIVVIAILAAISIVAYTGIQQRARDSERTAELNSLQKALELYHVDTGGYPRCGSTGPNTPPVLSSGVATSCLTDELVPNYISAVPADPTSADPYRYWYAAGYTKTGTTTFVSSPVADNYILGARLETKTTDFTSSGWGQTLNVLLGSSN